ncbi:MAG: hypothetical protein C5B47_02500 [Verrucomicrobia bacterium]|nr:MAG: hypothetical protein C5B47_02500 [Verrucomicrobiota bacterium]
MSSKAETVYVTVGMQPVANRNGIRVLMIFLAFLAVSCGRRPETPAAPRVEAVPAISRDVPFYLDTFGNCVTVASVTIQPQVTGILAQTLFKEGDFVTPGEKLYEVDPEPYQAALLQTRGDLETARANLWNAQQSLQRQTQLYAKQTIDVQTLQNAQAAERAAEGKVQSAEAALKQATINLGYCSITSPISGKTGVYLVNTGNLVTANTTKLINIQTIQPIYIDFTVPEVELGKIREDFDRNTLEVIATIPERRGYEARGKLQFLDNKVSAQAGTLWLRAQFENKDNVLWPGLYVNVRLILHTLASAVLVPQSAVLVGQNGPFLFVIDSTGHAHIRPVKTGELHDDLIVIVGGLKAGELVVTSGQLMLSDGALAKVRMRSPAETVENQTIKGAQ